MAGQEGDHSRFFNGELGKYPIPQGRLHKLRSDEVGLLEKYGHWLEALVQGKLELKTEQQKRFVAVAKGKGNPKTEFEWAWVKIFPTRGKKDDLGLGNCRVL